MQDVALVGKQDELIGVHRIDSYGFCQPMKLRVKCDGARDGGRTTNVIKHLHCACVTYARFVLKNWINRWNKTPAPSNFSGGEFYFTSRRFARLHGVHGAQHSAGYRIVISSRGKIWA